MYDTIIIGAGMSGLSAGCRLAHYEKKVCILEKHSLVGGLNSFYRQRGRNHDVGLHAVTNYADKGVKRGPLNRLLRQLRLTWEELALVPQLGSKIQFPGVTLKFTNNFSFFEEQVAHFFPKEVDGLRKLVSKLVDYNQLGEVSEDVSAREVVSSCIKDPKLVEMIFCPLMFYGSARQQDMDFNQFSIMFRSIFLEGFARPWEGVRILLRTLLDRFRKAGGELRLRAGVKRLLMDTSRNVCGVVLEDGTELRAKTVLSSVGQRETLRLCEDSLEDKSIMDKCQPGELGFVETISVLDRQPKNFGHDDTIVFFNDSENFDYRKPDDFCDLRSGVICSPNNFAYREPLKEGIIRITTLANYERWNGLSPEDYARKKEEWYGKIMETASKVIPDFRSFMVDSDMFTPKTIYRFTGHENGAIYGAPIKNYSGLMPFKNLFVCGTDQGMVGIIGAIISGITVVNRYLLSNNS
ncbi:MAG: NAD(P)/FAD-dependent oxidoreductase [Planctomycetaceae bacterium]|nr:NAD(P)/FAD-dependent oxidoreductase [Planctomycetaceae bacterium]